MIRKIFSLALLLCVLCLNAKAQELGKWRMYLSYQIATKSVAGGSVIYSLMNGNLLSYDTEDGEVRTYDRLGVLSDTSIAFIAYSKTARKLLIVYGNYNIDLLDADGNVQNLSALKDKRILNKDITDVCIDGSTAYLATGFGVVEVDMEEGVFRATYKLSFTINCITTSEDAVFIGTTTGTMRCLKSENMHLEENWTVFQSWGSVRMLSYFNGKVILMTGNTIHAADPSRAYSTKTVNQTPDKSQYTFLKNTGNQLIWGNNSQVCVTSDVSGSDAAALAAAVTVIPVQNQWSDVSYLGSTYWMSEQEKGLCGYKFDGTAFTPTGEVIQPSSPIRDLGYRVTWIGDRLLVAGGINTTEGFTNPATSMYYENGEWTNFTEMEIPADYPKGFKLVNTTDVVQDPLDDTHHFASLYRGGLCEYKNGKFVKHYNTDNSSLTNGNKPKTSRDYYRNFCSALSYDADGNLWMASTMVDPAFHILKPDGNWFSLRYKIMEGISLIDYIVHHSSGIKIVSSRRKSSSQDNTCGVYCIDTKGTETADDDKIILHQEITNQDGTTYKPDYFYCLYEDQDGKVWLGTSAGLFVIDDFSQIFSPTFRFTQVKINRDDGSGLADYLLNGVSISCITTDAANRLWIGTQSSGAYLISADGQEMLQHFTTEDSPLLSNYVQSIAVHPITGEVVFGTDKGLCSYISDATMPEDELEKDNVIAYPNPVTPDYNGPIAIRGLVADTEVKIVTTGGQLVWTGVSVGGTCVWNGCANDGRPVSSGMYHVVANTPDGDKAVVTRIVIVR